MRIKRDTFAGYVAREVRVQMARLDVTQKDLGAALGVSQPWISRRLSAETPLDVVELAAIARCLGCEVRDFMPEKYDHDTVLEFRRRREVPATSRYAALAIAA